jgi:hypothetical protein
MMLFEAGEKYTAHESTLITGSDRRSASHICEVESTLYADAQRMLFFFGCWPCPVLCVGSVCARQITGRKNERIMIFFILIFFGLLNELLALLP